MPRYKYIDRVRCDPRPGAILAGAKRSNVGSDCHSLPQLTEEERLYISLENRATPLIEIKVHEYAALIRRRSLEESRD